MTTMLYPFSQNKDFFGSHLGVYLCLFMKVCSVFGGFHKLCLQRTILQKCKWGGKCGQRFWKNADVICEKPLSMTLFRWTLHELWLSTFLFISTKWGKRKTKGPWITWQETKPKQWLEINEKYDYSHVFSTNTITGPISLPHFKTRLSL